jgi:hypothetical protein
MSINISFATERLNAKSAHCKWGNYCLKFIRTFKRFLNCVSVRFSTVNSRSNVMVTKSEGVDKILKIGFKLIKVLLTRLSFKLYRVIFTCLKISFNTAQLKYFRLDCTKKNVWIWISKKLVRSLVWLINRWSRWNLISQKIFAKLQ